MKREVAPAESPSLAVLLREHQETTALAQELIRLAIGARVALRHEEARAAERAAESCIAKAMALEEALKPLL